jgi:formylglycine-generating enzyme required for sulfatase activity
LQIRLLQISNSRFSVNDLGVLHGLQEQVAECDVMISVIGPRWLDARDETGAQRLNNPNDFVRIEIESALKQGKRVIPVLVGEARMPRANELPETMKRLAQHQSVRLTLERFRSDAQGLINALQRALETAEVRRRIKVEAAIIHGAPDGWFLPGNGKAEWFKEHEHGPEIVVVPAGEFMMGLQKNEPERSADEDSLHRVKLARPFAVGRHAVTRGQFAAFVNQKNYKTKGGAWVWTDSEWKHDPKRSWRNPGFHQDDNHPVVCVNWKDACAYVAWLSEATGHAYRLLSEAEWEYAARAGTTTPFWWGSSIISAQANYNGNDVYDGGGAEGEYRQCTVAVGSFEPNPWGLYNVHGNILEWCEDIWHENYNGAPADGSAWVEAWVEGGDGDRRVVRGGSWDYDPQYLRSATRIRHTTESRNNNLGFRVARTLTPY